MREGLQLTFPHDQFRVVDIRLHVRFIETGHNKHHKVDGDEDKAHTNQGKEGIEDADLKFGAQVVAVATDKPKKSTKQCSNHRVLFSLILLLCPALNTWAQSFNRVRADFTVKVKEVNGAQSLTMGQVCYDRNIRQVIYHLSFPGQETWISTDTVLYRLVKGKVMSRSTIPSVAEFTVFHLALSSQLQSFGLDKTLYKPEDVTREGELVITSWLPPAGMRKNFGKIMVSTQNRQLAGVVFFDPDEKILRKQFFEEFQLVSGISFPGKIVEINYINGIEVYQVTTFRNIVIDEKENDNDYYYPVSALR